MLRTVFERSFEEDPLRVLRAAQFAARFELSFDPKLVESAKTVSLEDVSAERVREELSKGLLLSRKPSLFFINLILMGKLFEAFSELEANYLHIKYLCALVDRSAPPFRLDALFWFLDRSCDELAWFVENVFEGGTTSGQVAKSTPEKNEGGACTGRRKLYRAGNKSGGAALYFRLRFSNQEYARATALSHLAGHFPEVAKRCADGESVGPLIRKTLKSAWGRGIAPSCLLEFARGMFPALYGSIGELWESELPEMIPYIEQPLINHPKLV